MLPGSYLIFKMQHLSHSTKIIKNVNDEGTQAPEKKIILQFSAQIFIFSEFLFIL